MASVSNLILSQLVTNFEYTRRVKPYIQTEFFEREGEKILFRHIAKFVDSYNAAPTYDSLYIELTKDRTIPEKVYQEIDTLITDLKAIREAPEQTWLIETTEKFCKERALFNALGLSIEIQEGRNKVYDVGAIPEILTTALSVGFDNSIGHNYFDNAADRWRYYHAVEEKISTGLRTLDRVMLGGVSNKTLNLIIAGPHAGKTALLCNFAANALKAGKNVLYITLEMAEKEIAKRIDANLLDIALDELMNLNEQMFLNQLMSIKRKTEGILVVKEYPSGAAHAGHFRTLLNELKLKKGYIPDLICVDYLNICASYRIKGNDNMYSYIKSIGEELRGLATEFGLPIWSATQLNRSGATSSDPGMDGVSESFGTNFTNDFSIFLVATDELKKQGYVLAKQAKNRYDDMGKYPKFLLGFNRSKMQFYDLDDPTSNLISDDIPVMDRSQIAKPKVPDAFDFN